MVYILPLICSQHMENFQRVRDIIDMHDTGPNRPSSWMACWNMRCHELYALYLENFGLQHPVFSMALAFYMYGYTRSSLSLVAL